LNDLNAGKGCLITLIKAPYSTDHAFEPFEYNVFNNILLICTHIQITGVIYCTVKC
jgi:hypothetical protein